MTIREELTRAAHERILILDGAMGTMVQALPLSEADFRGARFACHAIPLRGISDVLCLSQPDVICGIHTSYLEAGADIIKTCSFNAASFALGEYGLKSYAREISEAAAQNAKKAIADFEGAHGGRHFAAGVLGGASKSASIPPNLDDPFEAAVSWDDLVAAYYENAAGLLDGGADIFLIETIYDTLNAKAAIFAIKTLLDERGVDVPIMLSATIQDAGGRLLAGQTIPAFIASVMHAEPFSIGLNCSLGAREILPHLRTLTAGVDAMRLPCLVSVHPNAGLPGEDGSYNESPYVTASLLETAFDEGLVNIAGGCCGTTPAHINAIVKSAQGKKPRKFIEGNASLSGTWLSGFEAVKVKNDSSALTFIAGRCNVSGSAKFMRYITEENWDAALRMAREALNDGASLLDICMDGGLFDAVGALASFVRLALADPAIARAPFVLDSSDWRALESALKLVQGKCVVNSLSLKDGEAEFLRRAKLARRYGAAIMVLLFDEKGQAESAERKIAIARRAASLLKGACFPLCDCIIDPNVLTIGTGIPEHDRYALSFLEGCAAINAEFPEIPLSAGVDNLSFAFRGNNTLRSALHAVFLHYAKKAGLSLAFSDKKTFESFDALSNELKKLIEDLLLYKNKNNNIEKLLKLCAKQKIIPEEKIKSDVKKIKNAGERIMDAMLCGEDGKIENDILELLASQDALSIVEGPLLQGMREVGKRFADGEMYLSEVLRAARVMKKAVSILEPHIQKTRGNELNKKTAKEKIILATVKGDVHDIGKNIVALVLACSGYEIIDLGVMVEKEKIVETAVREKAAAIGLSGLISPSLAEMASVAELMAERKMNIPLFIGGAAASIAHTALKIAPLYKNAPVVYAADAGSAAIAVRAFFSEKEKAPFLENLYNLYEKARTHSQKIQERSANFTIENMREQKIIAGFENMSIIPKEAQIIFNDFEIEKIENFIEWEHFINKWETQRAHNINYAEKEKIIEDAKRLLETIKKEKWLTLRGAIGFFPSAAENETLFIYENNIEAHSEKKLLAQFSFPRVRHVHNGKVSYPSLADFVIPKKNNNFDVTGFFALSAAFGLKEAQESLHRKNRDYEAVHLSFLAASLTEAFSRYAAEVRAELRNERGDPLPVKIRPAFGYPSCPDHNGKRAALTLLDAQKSCGFSITESAMLIPAESVCGMYFYNKDAFYF